MLRCPWVPVGDALYEAYHDHEWGVPVHSDAVLFEFLVLESAQAGLSWRTILGRREGYRAAFAGFDPHIIVTWGEEKIDELAQDARIIRNRAKIKATINNAKRFLEVAQEFGSFANYLWKFVDGKPIDGHKKTLGDYVATTPISDALAKDMKKRGFSFFGSTVAYAHMQAVGMVNDHTEGCDRYRALL